MYLVTGGGQSEYVPVIIPSTRTLFQCHRRRHRRTQIARARRRRRRGGRKGKGRHSFSPSTHGQAPHHPIHPLLLLLLLLLLLRGGRGLDGWADEGLAGYPRMFKDLRDAEACLRVNLGEGGREGGREGQKLIHSNEQPTDLYHLGDEREEREGRREGGKEGGKEGTPYIPASNSGLGPSPPHSPPPTPAPPTSPSSPPHSDQTLGTSPPA